MTGLIKDGLWQDPSDLEAARALLQARFDLRIGIWDLASNPTLRKTLLDGQPSTPAPADPVPIPNAAAGRARRVWYAPGGTASEVDWEARTNALAHCTPRWVELFAQLVEESRHQQNTLSQGLEAVQIKTTKSVTKIGYGRGIPKCQAARLTERARPRPLVSDPPPSAEEIDRRIAAGIVRAAMEQTVLAAQPAVLIKAPGLMRTDERRPFTEGDHAEGGP